jgi:hypothetical protein
MLRARRVRVRTDRMVRLEVLAVSILLLVFLCWVPPALAQQGAQRCKTDSDCPGGYCGQTSKICYAKNYERFHGATGPIGNPRNANLGKCRTDKDCKPGWTCGRTGGAPGQDKTFGVCVINAIGCRSDFDCPKPLTCVIGHPESTTHGTCDDLTN